jgi:hypothetical protein
MAPRRSFGSFLNVVGTSISGMFQVAAWHQQPRPQSLHVQTRRRRAWSARGPRRRLCLRSHLLPCLGMSRLTAGCPPPPLALTVQVAGPSNWWFEGSSRVMPADLHVGMTEYRMGVWPRPAPPRIPYFSPGYACEGSAICCLGSGNDTCPACSATATSECAGACGALLPAALQGRRRSPVAAAPERAAAARPTSQAKLGGHAGLACALPAGPSRFFGCNGELWDPTSRVSVDWGFAGYRQGGCDALDTMCTPALQS